MGADWRNGLSANASEGSGYASKPSQPNGKPNGTAKADAIRRDGCERIDAQDGGSTVRESDHITFAKDEELLAIYAESVTPNNFLDEDRFSGVNQDFTFSTVCFSQG